MAFSAKQISALRRNLDHRHVRTRSIGGRELSYIESWHAIAEANRIFGFDGWSRETLEPRCLVGREIRGTWLVAYVAKVRISVHAPGHIVVREGHGAGEGRGASAGEAHDMALKAAETDATKRALATFGNPFGLSLYLGGKARRLELVEENKRQSVISDRDRIQPTDMTRKSPSNEPGTIRNTAADVHPPMQLSADLQSAPGEPVQLDSTVRRDELPIAVSKRYRDRKHLMFVASQPCLLCGRQPCDAHHLRFAQPRAMGLKVSDEFTVPLCRVHHRQVHEAGNESAWWNDMDIDAIEIAKGLWAESREKQKLLLSLTPSS